MSQIHGIVKTISDQESLQVPQYHKSAIIVPFTLTEETDQSGRSAQRGHWWRTATFGGLLCPPSIVPTVYCNVKRAAA